jgi:hypothetical protein
VKGSLFTPFSFSGAMIRRTFRPHGLRNRMSSVSRLSFGGWTNARGFGDVWLARWLGNWLPLDEIEARHVL